MSCSVVQIHHLSARKLDCLWISSRVLLWGFVWDMLKCSVFLFHRELIWIAVPISYSCMTEVFSLLPIKPQWLSVLLFLVCLVCEGRCAWGSTTAYFCISPTPDFLAVKCWNWLGGWLKAIQQGCASISVLLVCCSRAYRSCMGKNLKDEMDLME